MLGSGVQLGGKRGEERFYQVTKSKQKNQQKEDPPEKIVEAVPSCNLERFLESIEINVPAHYLSKMTMRGWKTCDVEYEAYFEVGELWESFKEWSAYGAGVPLVLNESDSVVQYYVPFLSAIQLYGENTESSSTKSRPPGEDSGSDYFKDSSSDGSSDCEHEIDLSSDQRMPFVGEAGNSQGCLLFEYLEREAPFLRGPLADKILDLAVGFPELKTLKSCDLHSSSWFSVAWYPIYRIPMGPTLSDLDACFLTYHSLHTPMTGSKSASAPAVTYPKEKGGVPKISLPVFGLSTYKFKRSLWTSIRGCEHQLANSLSQAADNWLKLLQVIIPEERINFESTKEGEKIIHGMTKRNGKQGQKKNEQKNIEILVV